MKIFIYKRSFGAKISTSVACAWNCGDQPQGTFQQSGMEELTASPPLLSEHREHWTNECVTTNKFTHTEREQQKRMIQGVVHEGVGRRKRERGRGRRKVGIRRRVRSGETQATLIGHGHTVQTPFLFGNSSFHSSSLCDNGPRRSLSLCAGLQFLRARTFPSLSPLYRLVLHLQKLVFVEM